MADYPLLEVDNLCVSFRQGGNLNAAVQGVSFSLNRGEWLASLAVDSVQLPHDQFRPAGARPRAAIGCELAGH